MEIITGPFHPALEDALAEQIAAIKASDPLAPIAVIVPSDRIRKRMKILLALEKQMALAGVSFLTFHQLALWILESSGETQGRGLRDDFFFEELVRRLLRTRLAADTPFGPLADTPGGPRAVLATVRDLKEARVDPVVFADALAQRRFGPNAEPQLPHLIRLYAAYLEAASSVKAMDPSDVAVAAAEKAADCAALGQLAGILYYGFYDLTQVQIDLLDAVRGIAPTTVFFPLLAGHPAYAFAQTFFERHLAGKARAIRSTDGTPDRALGTGLLRLFAERPEHPLPERPRCRIVTASGPEDEVLAAAKMILRWVEREGLAFSEIGVVARTLDSYGQPIRRIFREHEIPFLSNAEVPLSLHPAAKAVRSLVDVLEGNFPRFDVMDLFASPYCKADGFLPVDPAGGAKPLPRVALWDRMSRELGITRGLSQWNRMRGFARAGYRFDARDDEDPEGRLPSEQVAACVRLVAALGRAFDDLPKQSSWSDYADRFGRVLSMVLTIPGWWPQDRAMDTASEVGRRLAKALRSMAELDAISPEVPLAEFLAAFRRRLEDETMAWDDASHEGVQVLDATAARAIPFKALILLGMNERIFPRAIREDAFLRDGGRRVIEATLGYKIGEKLAGFDEEKLLFAVLLGAASEQVTILVERSDAEGRPLVSSWYVAALRRALWDRKSMPEDLEVPRKLGAKRRLRELFDPWFTTPHEAAAAEAEAGRPAQAPLAGIPAQAERLTHALDAQARMESMAQRVTAFDGKLRKNAGSWRRLRARGLSATRLQDYARCPFQYLMRHRLGIAALERPEDISDIEAVTLGSMIHETFHVCFERLVREDAFSNGGGDLDAADLFESAFREILKRERATKPGYPLLWEILTETWLPFLKVELLRDIEEAKASGFVPGLFEVEAMASFPATLSEPSAGFPISGRLDRVDIRRAPAAYRVVDYKIKTGARPQTTDHNPLLAAVRGFSLQLPIYILLGADAVGKLGLPGVSATCESARFRYIAPRWPDGARTSASLEGNVWETAKARELGGTIGDLLRGMRDGFFHIQPDDYCKTCDYPAACRKNHRPTRWRSEKDPRCADLLAIRERKIEDKSS